MIGVICLIGDGKLALLALQHIATINVIITALSTRSKLEIYYKATCIFVELFVIEFVVVLV